MDDQPRHSDGKFGEKPPSPISPAEGVVFVFPDPHEKEVAGIKFSRYPGEYHLTSLKTSTTARWDAQNKQWRVLVTAPLRSWLDSLPASGWAVEGTLPDASKTDTVEVFPDIDKPEQVVLKFSSSPAFRVELNLESLGAQKDRIDKSDSTWRIPKRCFRQSVDLLLSMGWDPVVMPTSGTSSTDNKQVARQVSVTQTKIQSVYMPRTSHSVEWTLDYDSRLMDAADTAVMLKTLLMRAERNVDDTVMFNPYPDALRVLDRMRDSGWQVSWTSDEEPVCVAQGAVTRRPGEPDEWIFSSVDRRVNDSLEAIGGERHRWEVSPIDRETRGVTLVRPVATKQAINKNPQVVLAAHEEDMLNLCRKHGIEVVEAGDSKTGLVTLPLRSSTGSSEHLGIGDGIPVDLYGFQEEGVEFILKHRQVLVADQPGLGKTWQAIAAIKAAGKLPVVVVCPPSVLSHWESAMKETFPDAVVRVLRQPDEDGVEPPDVGIIPYTALSRARHCLPKEPKAVIWDEIHYAKNRRSVRSQLAARIGLSVAPDGLLIGMSGTPMPHRTVELTQPLIMLDRMGEFDCRKEFMYRYSPYEVKKTHQGHHYQAYHAPESSALTELHEKLNDGIMIRRKKTDVLSDLPDKQWQVHGLDLEPGMKKLYDDLQVEVAEQVLADIVERERRRQIAEGEIEEELDDDDWGDLNPVEAAEETTDAWSVFDALAEHNPENITATQVRSTRNNRTASIFTLRQMATLAKLPAVLEHVDNWLEGHTGEKLVLFAHHRAVISVLEERYNAAALTGSLSLEERDEAIQLFQDINDPGSPRVLIFGTGLGPEGVTLTAANTAMFVEQPWSPSACEQAEDRVHRITQTQKVTIDYLLAADTVDERVAAMIEQKRRTVSEAIDGEVIGTDDEPGTKSLTAMVEEWLADTARDRELSHKKP